MIIVNKLVIIAGLLMINAAAFAQYANDLTLDNNASNQIKQLSAACGITNIERMIFANSGHARANFVIQVSESKTTNGFVNESFCIR